MSMNTFFQIFLPFLYGRLSVSSPASYWQLQTHQRVLHIISNTWVINQFISNAICTHIIISLEEKAKHKLPFPTQGELTSERGKPEEPGAQRKRTVLVSSHRCRQHCSHRLHHRCCNGGWGGHPRTIEGSCKPSRMYSACWTGENRNTSVLVQEP